MNIQQNRILKQYISLFLALVITLTMPLSVLAEQTPAAYQTEEEAGEYTLGYSEEEEEPPEAGEQEEEEEEQRPDVSLGYSEDEFEGGIEVVPWDELEHGYRTNWDMRAMLRSFTEFKKLGDLPVNTIVKLPMSNGLTLPFRVVAKDYYNFGSGTILMSTQYVATNTYQLTENISGKYSFLDGSSIGSRGDSGATNKYLVNSFYPTIASDIRDMMIDVTQKEGYYNSDNYQNIYYQNQNGSYTNPVFMPSHYEMGVMGSATDNLWGSRWDSTGTADWSITNGSIWYTRTRWSTYLHPTTGNNTGVGYLHRYEVDGGTASKVWGAFRTNSTSTGVYLDFTEYAVPFIMLPNDTRVGVGNDGMELVGGTNEPPPASTLSKDPNAGSVNAWETSSQKYTASAVTDPDGDTVTYIFELSVNGGPYSVVQSGSSREYTRTFAATDNTIQVRERNFDGTEYSAYTTATATTIVRDTTKPTITVTGTPAAGNYTNGTVTLTVVVQDTQSGLKSLSVPAGLQGYSSSTTETVSGTGSVTKTYTATANGGYTFTVSDNAGNSDSFTYTVNNIDQTNPALTLTPSTTDWTNAPVAITVDMTDSVGAGLDALEVPPGTTEYPTGGSVSIGGGNSATRTFTVTENGDYTFIVKDRATNSATRTQTIDKIDTEKPKISTSVNPSSNWTAGDATITVTVSDQESGLKTLTIPVGVEGYQDGGSIDLTGKTNDTFTFTVLANGTYRFEVEDRAGNKENANAVVDRIDKDAPNITYTMSPAAGSFTNNKVSIYLTITDSGSGLASLETPDGSQALSGKTAYITFEATENKTYTFKALDAVGNPYSVNITVDQLDFNAPEATITASVEQYHNGSEVTLAIQAMDDYSGVASITLPNGDRVNSGSATFTIYANGTYTFYVFDHAGNQRIVNYEYNYFDRTAPKIDALTFEKTGGGLVAWVRSFLPGEDPSIANEEVKIIVTHSDVPEGTDAASGAVTLTYRIYNDGDEDDPLADWTTVDIATAPTFNREMQGKVDAYVTDAAGNDSTIYTFDLLLDGTKPTMAYTVDNEELTRLPVTVSVTGEDALSGFARFVATLPDGIEQVFDGDSFSYTFYANGTMTVKGYDWAGNVETLVITINNIDLTPPQIVSLSFVKTGNPLVRMFSSDGGSFNEEVKLNVQWTDTPEGLDAESGVVALNYRLYDEKTDQPVGEWVRVPIAQANSLTFNTEGGYYLIVNVEDSVGWYSYDRDDYQLRGEKVYISLDATDPVLSYTLEPDGFTSGNVTARIQGTDSGSGFSHFLIDGTQIDGDETTILFTENGTKIVTGEDFAGNSTQITVEVTGIDRTKPEIQTVEFEETEEGLWAQARALFTGAAHNKQVIVKVTATDTPEGTDAESGVNTLSYRLLNRDGSVFADWQSVDISVQPLLDRAFTGTLEAYVTDHAGNSSEVFQADISLDATAPTLEYTLSTDGPTNSEVVATITGEDAESGFSYFEIPRTGETFQGSTMTLTFSANGNEVVRGYDQAGNYSEITVAVDNIDTTAPEVTYTLDVEGFTNGDVTATITATDSDSGISHILIDGQRTEGGTATILYESNSSKIVTAYDQAGNFTTITIEVSNIDKDAPSLSYGLDPAGDTNGTVTATITGEDADSGFSHFIVQSTGARYEGDTFTLTFTANGTETVTGYDIAGNSTVLTVEVDNIDKTAPALVYTLSTYDPTDADVVATITGDDDYSGFAYFEIPRTGQTFQGSTMTLTFTVNGSEAVRGYDKAGNSTEITVIVENIDKTAPEVSYSLDVTELTNGNVTATITATDNGSGVAYILIDGQRTEGSTAATVFERNGSKTVAAYDEAGNVTTITVEVSNIDKTAPVLVELDFVETDGDLWQQLRASFGSSAANKQVQVTAITSDAPEGSDAESGVVKFVYRLVNRDDSVFRDWTEASITNLPKLEQVFTGKFECYIVDAVGNRSETYTADLSLDVTLPVLEYTLSTYSFTNRPVTVTITGFDADSGFSHFPHPFTGELVDGDTLVLEIPENKIFTVTGYDFANNKKEIQVTVDNIDLTPPTITNLEFVDAPAPFLRSIFGGASNTALTIKLEYDDTPIHPDAESGVATFSYRLYDLEKQPATDWITVPIDEMPVFTDVFNGFIYRYITDHAGNHSNQTRQQIIGGDEWTPPGPGGNGGNGNGEDCDPACECGCKETGVCGCDHDDGGQFISVDRTAPQLSYTVSTTDFTNRPVTVTITGFDADSGFSHFLHPFTGEVVEGDTLVLEIPENKTFVVTGFDKAKNSEEITVTVDNIDMTPPMTIKAELVAVEDTLLQRASRLLSGGGLSANGTAVLVLDYTDEAVNPDAESGVETLTYMLYSRDGEALTDWIMLPIGQWPVFDLGDYRDGVEFVHYLTDRAGNHSNQTRENIINGDEWTPPGSGGNSGGNGEDCDPQCECGCKETGICECGNGGDGGIIIIIEEEAPIITYTVSTTKPTKGAVTVNVHGYDAESGFSHFIINDERYDSDTDTATIIVERNIILEVYGFDNAGNSAHVTIPITNIDLTPPVLTVTDNRTERRYSNSPVILAIEASDPDEGEGMSGVARIILPDGTEIEGDSATYTARKNGDYEITAVDYAGNSTIVVWNVRGISTSGGSNKKDDLDGNGKKTLPDDLQELEEEPEEIGEDELHADDDPDSGSNRGSGSGLTGNETDNPGTGRMPVPEAPGLAVMFVDPWLVKMEELLK